MFFKPLEMSVVIVICNHNHVNFALLKGYRSPPAFFQKKINSTLRNICRY
jgi:hypothetical protein